MKILQFLKFILQNFRLKVFVIVAIVILLMTATFTVYFVQQRYRSLNDELIKMGSVLSGLLANNSKLGIFSENERFLKDPAEGVLEHDGVSSVYIFTKHGKILIGKERSSEAGERAIADKDIYIRKTLELMKESKGPFYFEHKEKYDFWAPVISKTHYLSEDALFFEESETKIREDVIGFVNISLDKSILNVELRRILIRASVMGVILLLTGFFMAYYVTGWFTKPLNRLTEAVRAAGAGGPVEDVPVETADEIGRLAESFNDMISSLKKREADKLQIEAQLRQSQKMEAVGQLAGGVAHEINNPINSIINYAQLIIDEGEKGSSEYAFAERIIAEGGRIANIVKGLLAFSRESREERRKVSISEVISETLSLIAVQLKKDGINLILDMPGELPEIKASPQHLVQVFLNIIDNSRYALNQKYPARSEDKFLKITCEEVSVDNSIYVRATFYDRGTGIPSEMIEQVTNPFFTTKPAGSGTGLGLSISYGIIEEHGGRFRINSVEGEYAEFVIDLPAAGREE